MTTLSNKSLTVQINNHGAELCSIRDSAGTEFIWQADPAVWNRHAPVLFPVVGKLRDNRCEIDGNIGELPQHGFARDMNFELIEQGETSRVFLLRPTAETRKNYPCEFDLKIIYRLSGRSLQIQYDVRNTGNSLMPFSIGAHPGFALPGPIDECFLEFEKPEELRAHLLGSSGLLSEETVPVELADETVLPLSATLFDRDALIFMDTKSDKITLGSKNSSRRLTVEFGGFPQLGIWSKPGAPFVCIEPWFGYADSEAPYGDLCRKPGIINLKAGESFQCSYRILIDN